MIEKAPSGDGKVEKAEIVLTPKDIENVVAKAIDINAPGHGYTVLNAFSYGFGDRLGSILENGILGTGADYTESSILGGAPSKESWAKHARAGEATNFYFNITGRGGLSFRHPGERLDIKNSEHFGYPGEKIAVVFDLSDFTEEEPASHEFDSKTRRFRADDPYLRANWKKARFEQTPLVDEEGRPRPHTKYGFIGSRRIAPRLFKGLVYKFRQPKKLMEILREEKFVQDSINRLANIILHSVDSPEAVIPIYDQRGNMLWPAVLPYDILKQRDSLKE